MEIDEFKKLEKRRLTTNVGVDAYEKLRFQNYLTRKSVGHVITELVMEHLEEPPPKAKDKI